MPSLSNASRGSYAVLHLDLNLTILSSRPSFVSPRGPEEARKSEKGSIYGMSING
jgi:hypothetical protein